MNTEAKISHTPGPWILNGRTNLGYRIDSLGVERTGVEFLNAPISIAPRESDARLIAAAPELLEIAKKALDVMHYLSAQLPGEDAKANYVMRDLEGLIAKAEAV